MMRPAMAQVADYLDKQLERRGLEVQPLVVSDPKTGVTLHTWRSL